ncbi:MAG: hypothetical protein ACKOQZ_00015, partial [Actinomycetota bacterium]
MSITSRFPGLADGWARFDGPAGTQMVDVAIRAMSDWAASGHNANTGGSFSAAQECDALLTRTRDVLGRLFNADPRGICLGANMTTMTFASWSSIVPTTRSCGERVRATARVKANVIVVMFAPRQMPRESAL